LVTFGLSLLWLAFTADFIHKLANIYFYRERPDAGLLAVWGATAGIIFLIGRCHNWARFIYAFTFVPVCISSLPRLVSSLSRFPAPTIFGLLTVLAVVCGTVLLFLPASSRWFNAKTLGKFTLGAYSMPLKNLVIGGLTATAVLFLSAVFFLGFRIWLSPSGFGIAAAIVVVAFSAAARSMRRHNTMAYGSENTPPPALPSWVRAWQRIGLLLFVLLLLTFFFLKDAPLT